MTRFDGVIEAVRYKGGKVDAVRVYERRGAAFSDRILLNRKKLVDRLKQGQRFVTGERKEFLAGTFETGKAVNLIDRDTEQFISTNDQAERDELEGVPVF